MKDTHVRRLTFLDHWPTPVYRLLSTFEQVSFRHVRLQAEQVRWRGGVLCRREGDRQQGEDHGKRIPPDRGYQGRSHSSVCRYLKDPKAPHKTFAVLLLERSLCVNIYSCPIHFDRPRTPSTSPTTSSRTSTMPRRGPR